MHKTGQARRSTLAHRRACLCALGLTLLLGRVASAADLPRGAIVDDVECEDAPAQHYTLYLPSNFTPARAWPVILIFDAAARGRQGVERYQAAAERYGYIVAGSNNSRNGPWEPSLDAATAMSADVAKRFPVDARRVYTAGMSGGARVAIMVALRSDTIAGVLASSAGYADTFHESLRFPLFGTAGTEDFNYREVHAMDLRMKSPHRVEVFEGGHTWLPADLATEGVEWMEVQAMKRGARSRDDRLLDDLFAKRMTRAQARADTLGKMRALKLIAADFDGLHDVVAVTAAAAALEARPEVAEALSIEREDDLAEWQVSNDLGRLTRQLSWPERQAVAFQVLTARVETLAQSARATEDSTNRRLARRALAGLRASARDIPHPEFRTLMDRTTIP